MKLKGSANLILTDVRTGQTDEIHEDNIVTNALQKIVDNISSMMEYEAAYYHKGGSTYEYITPLYNIARISPIFKRALGGVLLFDGNIEENKDIVIKPDNVQNIGYAGLNLASNPLNPYLGTYNEAASGVTEDGKGYKWVWEFNTSQANGTINSISLTSPIGGETGYIRPVGDGIKTYNNSYLMTYGTFDNPNVRNARPDVLQKSTYVPSDTRSGEGVYFNRELDSQKNIITYGYIYDSDEKGSYFEKAKSKALKTSLTLMNTFAESTDKTVIKRLYCNEKGLKSPYSLDKFGTVIGDDKYLLVGEYDNIQIYDFEKEEELLRLRTGATYNDCRGLLYQNKIYVYNAGSTHVYEVDPLNKTYIKLSAENTKNFASVHCLFIYKNKLFACVDCNDGYFHKLTEVKKSETGFEFVEKERYMEERISTTGTMVWTSDISGYCCSATSNWLVPIYITPYLATINNLQSPIVKDKNKTLKIVYTIREVE